MKILKHAKELPYKTAYGTLHGLRYEDKNIVEVSNCYAALPNSEEVKEITKKKLEIEWEFENIEKNTKSKENKCFLSPLKLIERI